VKYVKNTTASDATAGNRMTDKRKMENNTLDLIRDTIYLYSESNLDKA
jgi:hypothetical protein